MWTFKSLALTPAFNPINSSLNNKVKTFEKSRVDQLFYLSQGFCSKGIQPKQKSRPFIKILQNLVQQNTFYLGPDFQLKVWDLTPLTRSTAQVGSLKLLPPTYSSLQSILYYFCASPLRILLLNAVIIKYFVISTHVREFISLMFVPNLRLLEEFVDTSTL